MKNTLWMLALVVFATTSHAAVRLSDPITADEFSETFGALHDSTLPNVSLSMLLSNPINYLKKPVQLQTRIAKVCQKKGCFFIAQQDKFTVRVAFKDYGFYIPTDSSNKLVTLNGELIETTVTQEQADHLADDLGQSGESLETGRTFELLASSVTIPK